MKTKITFLSLVTFFALINLIFSQNLQQLQKLIAPNRLENTNFGISVASNDNYLVVGEYQYSLPGKNYCGVAHIYQKNNLNQWVFMQTIVSNDIAAGDKFGFSVDISPTNKIIVGAYSNKSVSTNAEGAAYIFELNNQTWIQTAKLNPQQQGWVNQFGYSVSIWGNYVVVGAPQEYDNGVPKGKIYFFEFNGTNWNLIQSTIPLNTGEYDKVGYKVDVNNNFAVIGNPANNLQKGKVYIYQKNNISNSWDLKKSLQPSSLADMDNFGYALSIDYSTLLNDTLLAVGAYYHDLDSLGNNSLSNAGAVYVFKCNNNNWDLIQKITPADRKANDYFGKEVFLKNNKLYIGAEKDEINVGNEGTAYIYEFNTTLQKFIQKQEISSSISNTDDLFGTSISANSDYLFVSAPFHDYDLNNQNPVYNSGAAYIFGVFNPILNISGANLTIADSANSTATFDITSNIGWTVATNENWLTVSNTSGSNNATITLTAQANPTTATRTATVTVSGNGVSSQIITVTQSGAAPILTVSTSALTVSALANSTATFDITSNIGWTVATNENWLTASNTSGSNNATITLTAQANPTTATRTATVTVSGNGVSSQTITVTQSGAAPILTVSTSALTVNATANSTATFDITSNIGWTVATNENWLTASNTSGSNNATITLTAQANPTTATRTATVTVSGNGVNSQTITVTQSGAAPILTVSTSTLTVNATANSTATFDITSNTDWTIDIDQIWLSANLQNGNGNATITLTAAQNTTTSPRNATVTISTTTKISHQITVTQYSGTAVNTPNLSTRNILVYPSPATDILLIKNVDKNSIITIFDLTGKQLINFKLQNEQINISELSNGIYIIRIKSDNFEKINKFIKQ